MKLILSRKGFDSSSGGCPNPIFPDGSVLALPIPDGLSRIRYQDINHELLSGESLNVGNFVKQLTKGKIKSDAGAHLDPDLLKPALPRQDLWQPVLGQHGSAQGHLAKQKVDVGDLFLFFGLFRPVEQFKEGRKKPVWRFVPGSRPIHRLWGWMQIGHKLEIPEGHLEHQEEAYQWLDYHPHVHGESEAHNVLYLSSKSLSLDSSLSGCGTFDYSDESHILTEIESQKPSLWKLPEWFFPYDPQNPKTPLSYHTKANRWNKSAEGECILQSVARGQEFVLDVLEYPEAKDWLCGLINKSLHCDLN